MAAGRAPLDLDDIQGLVIRGYRMPLARYLFYRFDSGTAARSWLRAMIEPVTTASEWDAAPASCVNIALTYGGLEASGLPPESLASFPGDFREGMAVRAAAHLGETGRDLPPHWPADPPFAARGVHALLLISAREKDEMERRHTAVAAVAEAIAGVVPVGRQEAAVIGPPGQEDREHFGFRDGISQPTLKGSGLEDTVHAGREAVEPGEFLLGHPDELGRTEMPWPAALGHNGTYAVYRKLHQDVAAFRAFVRGSGHGDLLAAKMMGRWPSGAPLVLSPDADDAALAGDPRRVNDFDYAGDPLGYACPRGAHVRRARPRDGRPSSRRRLLIRRGLPYGPVLPDGAPDDGIDRGLVGMFLGAGIERQFEFVQRMWLADQRFDGLSGEADPITGPGSTGFTWQKRPVPLPFTDLPRFVTVRGGDYFFLPGITGLRYLAGSG